MSVKHIRLRLKKNKKSIKIIKIFNFKRRNLWIWRFEKLELFFRRFKNWNFI